MKRIISVCIVCIMMIVMTFSLGLTQTSAATLTRVNGIQIETGSTVIYYYKTGPYSSNLSAVDFIMNYTTSGLTYRSFKTPNITSGAIINPNTAGRINLVASNISPGYDFTTKKYLAIGMFKVKASSTAQTITATVNGFYNMNGDEVTPTSKATSFGVLGDTTGDYAVTVVDATKIQQYLSSLTTLSDDQLIAADVNFDGVVDIKDVTHIQKYLAGLITEL